MQPDFYVGLMGNLSCLGFILWLVVRMTNHTIPRLVNDFKEGIEKQRNDFKQMSMVARSDFLSQITEQRETFKEQLEREREISHKPFLKALNELNHKER